MKEDFTTQFTPLDKLDEGLVQMNLTKLPNNEISVVLLHHFTIQHVRL